MVLLDTTVLSNFSHIARLDLLRLALPDAVTTPYVIAELERGVSSGRLPNSEWEWLKVLKLAPSEETRLIRIRLVLDEGEASCIAVAIEREAGLFSDDLDARRYAQRLGIHVSGTLGVLAFLINRGYLTLVQADKCLQGMIAHGYRSPTKSLADLSDAIGT